MKPPSSLTPPDGVLRYRLDPVGAVIAILPTRCKSGRHPLVPGISTVRAAGGELRIDCPACATTPGGTDTRWRWTGDHRYPDRVELDERFYDGHPARRPRAAKRQEPGES
ncbi:hypothetical protein [Actinokineospora globicatena]|uniref:hypothetical protein n=1 Tax=Actinokineospora globicatena TaxID=103729 RepID=UPI0020A5094E|nr:hypothetical protein [Actinokineospora globicatena]